VHLMTRKDSEKDSERPHYYSQFWLDVAAGRRVIGGPRPEEGEVTESAASFEPEPQRRAYPGETATSKGQSDHFVHPGAETIGRDESVAEPDTESISDMDEINYQDEIVDDLDIPDMDFEPLAEDENEDEDEDYYEEEDEDTDDDEGDDMNWGRGRKKGKPLRSANKLSAKKPGKRDSRRGY
jgi:hypothetical protein